MNQIKRSLTLSGHKTSIALENEFWIALEAVSYTHLTLPTTPYV